MPPRYVKPYVKRNKNDAADAEAICEAVTRPTMRFVMLWTAPPPASECATLRCLRNRQEGAIHGTD
jgi:transposase